MQKSVKFLGFLVVLGISGLALAGTAKAGGGPAFEQPGYQISPTSSNSAAPDIDGSAMTNTPSNTNQTNIKPAVAGVSTNGVFKLANNPTVYVLIDGQMHPFTSAAAFTAWGFKFSQVETISQTRFQTFVIGANLGIPDGSLVKGSGPTTYIVFNGQKNVAAPESLINQLGLSLSNTVIVSDNDLANIPLGPAITNY